MFHIILGPAMAIMSRLRFGLKIGLIGLLFLAPLTALLIYLYGKLQTEIKYSETERLGVQQIVPGRGLLKELQNHRGESVLALSGDQAAKEKLIAIESRLEDWLKLMSDLDETIGVTLKTRGGIDTLKNQWIAIKAHHLEDTSEESFKRHSVLIDGLFDYWAEISDKSGLTTEGDLDAFYVGDAAIMKIPHVMASIGRMRGWGAGILKRQVMTPDEKTELVVLDRSYEDYFPDLQGDYKKAIEASPALASVLDAKIKEMNGSVQYFVNNDAAAVIKGDFSLGPNDYFKHASTAVDAIFGVFDVSMDQLDKLLVARINRLQSNLILIFGGTALVLAVVFYLFAGMLFSVLRSLRSIEAGAERLARGDVSELVDSHSRDELREVGGAVNSVVQTLQKFTKAELDMARAHNEHGRISEEMRASEFPGAYGDMARNLNAMVKGHIDIQIRFTELMGEYAGGKFDNRMPPLPGERRGISDAAEKVRGGLEASAKAASFNALVKVALDHVSIPVRIADDEGQILYINKALQETLRKYEAGFRRQIPGFDRDKVVGGSIGMFLGGNRSAAGYLHEITQATTSRMIIGGRDFEIVTTPVVDNGKRLGTAGQWTDITEQLAAEREISAIVEAAADGDFTKRIADADKSGFMLQMSQGLNTILGTNEQALGEIGRILKALAQGDLSQDIRADFKGVFAELKGNSNETISKLRDIITQIREASVSINTAAREIAMGNNDLSRRTEEQASSLEETASSMEEFASTVKLNAENAQQANRLAAEASESAARGGEVVAQVVTTMNGITESNREIADITTLIDGIAFQTNLLALNAAVEAARAGEQGRGFAVVASEVRNLAQRAAEAAKNIKAVIANSIGKVQDGARLVESAGQSMEEIVAQVKRVSAIIGEIAAASKEQSGGIQQVNQAITQIDQITQQNAALVEEATAAAKSLEGQSDTLVQAVAIFKLVHGHGTTQKREPVAQRVAQADVNAVLH